VKNSADTVHEIVRVELGQMSLDKREPSVRTREREIFLLRATCVEIRERINTDDVLSLFEKCLRQVGPEEAGATSYEVATQDQSSAVLA
jgi:hypothetical protein